MGKNLMNMLIAGFGFTAMFLFCILIITAQSQEGIVWIDFNSKREMLLETILFISITIFIMIGFFINGIYWIKEVYE